MQERNVWESPLLARVTFDVERVGESVTRRMLFSALSGCHSHPIR